MKVILIKHIHSSFSTVSSGDVFINKEITLSAIPRKGEKVVFLAPNGDKVYEQVSEIYYNDGGEVEIYVNADKEFYNSLLASRQFLPEVAFIDFKAHVMQYVQMGWYFRSKFDRDKMAGNDWPWNAKAEISNEK